MSQSTSIIWSERLRLASLSRVEMLRIGLVSCMVGMIYVLFHVQGNTTDIQAFGRSAILWMVARWKDSGLAFGTADYSHGALIPVVSAAFIWYKREALIAARKQVSRIGLAVVITALLFHWLGAKAQQVRASLFGLVLLLWGIPFYLFGWQVAKQLIFPVAYLIFCIPLNFLDSLSFPLRILMTKMTAFLLNGIGIAVERTGSAILAADGSFSLDVADPCSGLRSLLAMTALTAAYAYITQKTLVRKWLLFLASIPLAILGNMARILTVAMMAQAFGAELATGLYHDFSGYVIFMSFTIPLMIALGAFLNQDFKEQWKLWKNKLLNPT